jgi:hypothetical protein
MKKFKFGAQAEVPVAFGSSSIVYFNTSKQNVK